MISIYKIICYDMYILCSKNSNIVKYYILKSLFSILIFLNILLRNRSQIILIYFIINVKSCAA